jgi:two-component system cell cycle response regulator
MELDSNRPEPHIRPVLPKGHRGLEAEIRTKDDDNGAPRSEFRRVDDLLMSYLSIQPGRPCAPSAVNSWSPTEPPYGRRAPGTELLGDDLEEDRTTAEWEPASEQASMVRDRAVLLRVDADGAGQLESLSAGNTVLGRSSRAEVTVADERISRFHARITSVAGLYTVMDLRSKNGTFVNGRRVEASPLADGDLLQLGSRASFRFALMDLAHESALRQLWDSSVSDPLTGAFNRRHFNHRLASELAFARRHETELAMTLFDIDHFKRINDTYGHTTGDMVLRKVADVCRKELRAEDFFARYGGEEFVVLLRQEGLEEAKIVADRIRRRVAEAPIAVDGKNLKVTISVGCASLRALNGAGSNALVEAADRCLYAAKESGRNRVVG